MVTDRGASLRPRVMRTEAMKLQELPWADIEVAIRKRVGFKWRGVDTATVDDAVGVAMLALIDKWPDFPSTRKVLAEGDPSKVTNYAVKYGYYSATNALVQTVKRDDETLHFVHEDEFTPHPNFVSMDTLPEQEPHGLSDEQYDAKVRSHVAKLSEEQMARFHDT